MKVVKALMVNIYGVNRTYRSPTRATVAIVNQMIWRMRVRDEMAPWPLGKRVRIYKRAYPRVNKIVKQMMGEK